MPKVGMNKVGTYEELLPCGGKLKVSIRSWEITYYFSGPDLRHNGTFVSIPGKQVRQYIDAFNENWAEYEKLRHAVPTGGEFFKTAAMGMSIRIGAFTPGVCLRSYHMPVKSKDQLKAVIAGYEYAIKRSKDVQRLLEQL